MVHECEGSRDSGSDSSCGGNGLAASNISSAGREQREVNVGSLFVPPLHWLWGPSACNGTAHLPGESPHFS